MLAQERPGDVWIHNQALFSLIRRRISYSCTMALA
jgi:hypothetical protein